jgi:hypothetical protein
MHPREARDVPGRRQLLELWLTEQMNNFFVRALVTKISEASEPLHSTSLVSSVS